MSLTVFVFIFVKTFKICLVLLKGEIVLVFNVLLLTAKRIFKVESPPISSVAVKKAVSNIFMKH